EARRDEGPRRREGGEVTRRTTPVNIWEQYTPDAKAPWTLRRVVHLHRRAAFAVPWDKLQRDLADGPAAAVGLFTALHPDAPPSEVKPAHTKRGQRLSGRRGGRPERHVVVPRKRSGWR